MKGAFHRNLNSTWLFFTDLLKLIRYTEDGAKWSLLSAETQLLEQDPWDVTPKHPRARSRAHLLPLPLVVQHDHHQPGVGLVPICCEGQISAFPRHIHHKPARQGRKVHCKINGLSVQQLTSSKRSRQPHCTDPCTKPCQCCGNPVLAGWGLRAFQGSSQPKTK